MMGWQWLNPWALWLLLCLPVLLYTLDRRSKRRLPSISFSDLRLVAWSKATRPSYEQHLPLALLALALVLATLALARPRHGISKRSDKSKAGIDIMLCLDTSGSMQAMDLAPNRLTAALTVSKAFVEARPDDRIGLVVFAGQAVTQCPLTSDHSALLTYLDQVRIGATGTDGTAIGNGLATALNRLKKVQSKSKVVILLTDGRNNAGELDPLGAAKLAKSLGVRVYTIGAGKRGEAPMPVPDPFGFNRRVMVRVDIDEGTLQAIASETGGRYFRATDTEGLANVYEEINRLEKTDKPKEEIVEYRELYAYFLIPAIFLLAAHLWLRSVVWGELP